MNVERGYYMDMIAEVKKKLECYCERLGFDAPVAQDELEPATRFRAALDYDPITHATFLMELLLHTKDRNIRICYLDASATSINRVEEIDRADIENGTERFKSFRARHVRLFDCTVEGSYFMKGDMADWLVFYDAATDMGVFQTASAQILDAMGEYVVQVPSEIRGSDQRKPL